MLLSHRALVTNGRQSADLLRSAFSSVSDKKKSIGRYGRFCEAENCTDKQQTLSRKAQGDGADNCVYQISFK